ncbi:TPA: DUF4232 domain-containing protein [Serratia liquefaciens]
MRYFPPLYLAYVSLLLLPVIALADLPSIYPCEHVDISVRLDDRNGLYDGMSQSGTELVLYNTGTSACMLPPLPALTFSDRAGRVMAVERRISRGMHPGPALPPVIVTPDNELRIVLRWVASDVYDGGTCVRPASVSLSLAGGVLSVPFERMMCTATGQNGYYTQSLTGTP